MLQGFGVGKGVQHFPGGPNLFQGGGSNFLQGGGGPNANSRNL